MYFDVVAVVDPVTREAQKLAPLLLVRFYTAAVHLIGSPLTRQSRPAACRF